MKDTKKDPVIMGKNTIQEIDRRLEILLESVQAQARDCTRLKDLNDALEAMIEEMRDNNV